jgi:hypothetical protein
MDGLSQINVAELSAALAADLAAELYDHETVFKNHGLSLEVGQSLLAQPWFRAMVEQARRDWDALDNTKDRIRAKAQIALEESIPTVYGLISDKNTPGAARVAAFKEMKEIAGMGRAEGPEGGAGFIPIQIFLDGREAAPITIKPTATGYTSGNQAMPEPDDLEDAEEITPEAALAVAKAVAHAAAAGDSEPCFTLGMEDPA